MNYSDIEKKLNQIKNEDFIWLIYIGIIFLSWYSNSLEKKYFLYNDLESKEKYRKIMILIFSIVIIIYIYFLYDSYNSIKNINPHDSNEKNSLVYLSFVGSLLIALSGFIFLYIAIKDEDINVELAFN